jgi:3-oxoacyl-[acyl-carrier protein] reductase
MDLGLKGKRAMVTGGSSGIGRSCAVELASEGVTVCVVARNEERLAETVALTKAAGQEGFSVSADLSTEEGCRAAFDAAIQGLGGVDILVNSAGAAQRSPVLNLPTSMIDDALDLKLYSALRLSQLVVPGMTARQWGRIINIAGATGTNPTEDTLPVSFANVTMLNFTRGLSDVVSKDGILVNVICPGAVNTPRGWARWKGIAEREGRSYEDVLLEEAEIRPAGRICEPEEIGRVVCFLASEACSYIHASAIYMDGGARRGIP